MITGACMFMIEIAGVKVLYTGNVVHCIVGLVIMFLTLKEKGTEGNGRGREGGGKGSGGGGGGGFRPIPKTKKPKQNLIINLPLTPGLQK